MSLVNNQGHYMKVLKVAIRLIIEINYEVMRFIQASSGVLRTSSNR